MGKREAGNALAWLLRQLPAFLLTWLDAWSHRVAQRRARQRQERWLRRQPATGPR